MRLSKAFIPYGNYFSSAFCRWQGAFQSENAFELAAHTTKRFFSERRIDTSAMDMLVLGATVPQKHSFYGAPWLSGVMGLEGITGPTVSQACATSTRALATLASAIEVGESKMGFILTCDRTSNGPHILYPNPKGVGGRGDAEDPVWDNFNKDPYAKNAMIETAENVARAHGISKEEQDDVALLRFEQYKEAMKNERAFLKRWMFGVELREGKKTTVIDQDEGVFPTTKDGLKNLRPVVEGGTVTYGTQTHPADGHAAIVVATKEQAARTSRDPKIEIQILGFAQARVAKGMMPTAPVPAAERVLQNVDIRFSDLSAVKTHNPFAVNDVYFSRMTKIDLEKMNRFGSPLVYGHPQGPTGARAMIELIEELVDLGGGLGLFTGCAAGDTAMATVIKVRCS